MARQMTDSAVIAQMVRDAIYNETRKDKAGKTILSDTYERAKLWHERAKLLNYAGRCYYGHIANKPLDEFLCETNPSFGILDYVAGEVVECEWGNRLVTGVIRETRIDPSSGTAIVVFPNGEHRDFSWRELSHSKIPDEILEVAKAQFIASNKCPFSKEEEE